MSFNFCQYEGSNDSLWRKKHTMTFGDFTAWMRQQRLILEPAPVAIVDQPFDDGLIEIDRLLRVDDRSPPKSLPSFWPPIVVNKTNAVQALSNMMAVSDRWTEILRCPRCALTGVATLFHGEVGDVVSIIPLGFRPITSQYGDTFFCTACNRAATTSMK
jgi:hypothetical protein